MEENVVPKNKRSLKEWLLLIMIVVIIIGVGMFAINQTLGFYYKSQFLQSPCQLCVELNPEFNNNNINKVNLTEFIIIK